MIAQLRSFLLILTAGALAACTPREGEAGAAREVAPVLLTDEARDVHSYARPAEARVTHVSLDLAADFEARRLVGSAELDLEVAEDAAEVVLDSNGLDIRSVSNPEGEALRWELGENDEAHGAPLTIALDGAERIRIEYASAPDAVALQWLAPEQTAGGEKPFLFSQGQAILNRSWIPTQDSPGIRQTWDARIIAPEGLRVVMSAEMLTPEGERVESEGVEGGDGAPMRAFRFEMDNPVAPYLIAIAVGDLAFSEIGPRTGVYAEPSVLPAATREFADIEAMIAAAELLYGPYRWGRYDLLVLPPSFPFGGMENPRLTFVTPTVIAGDRSLVSLIAHELAHSWSGNLVTNATWDDFWLNEGFTVYIENRIMEQVYGPEQAAMLADLGWSDMEAAFVEAGGPRSPDTQLHLDLADRDPDEGTTQIAYEKGAVFLRTLEHAVGREAFDAWLRGYFDRYAFQPQTSAGLLADLREHLFTDNLALAERIGIERWIFQPGLPSNAFRVTSDRLLIASRAATAFAENGDAAAIPWDDWTTQERMRFIAALPRELPAGQLAALDQTLDLSETGNSELRFAWLMLAIPNRYDPARPSAEAFLTSMGRRKFVAPLYEALMAEEEWGAPFARTLYEQARASYHSVTTGAVDETVGHRTG